MDDQASMDGMPQLDRQPVPVRRDAHGRPLAPSRVPETRPTPLQGVFIYLSAVALVCGVIVISALELGTPPSSLMVKVPALIGGFLLALVTVDAIVRVWRSAFAWLPVDRGLGLFRFVWVVVLVGVLVAVVLAAALVVAA
ncbi:MAG TPA: hypothetical protein VFK38_05655 [Candidatus Limnocylindrales bacterium]|nr:hypothetical protein [Candidatus Limnocylindrales bacterium]